MKRLCPMLTVHTGNVNYVLVKSGMGANTFHFSHSFLFVRAHTAIFTPSSTNIITLIFIAMDVYHRINHPSFYRFFSIHKKIVCIFFPINLIRAYISRTKDSEMTASLIIFFLFRNSLMSPLKRNLK